MNQSIEIVAIVEPWGVGYRARCRHPVSAEATGASRLDAVLGLESVLRGQIPDPFTILSLEVTPDKPWIATAGSVPDDALTDEWLAAIEQYRRECDAADTQTPPTQISP
jgi:hypothetical protein